LFKVSDIRELIRLVDETSVHELEVESGELRFRIVKAPVQVVNAPTPSAVTGHTVALSHDAVPIVAQPQVNSAAILDVEASVTAGTALITSPMVGTFYRSPSPTAPPCVEVGMKVTEKTVVCIVEAMKLMNEIEADVRGEIIEVLADNGSLIEYGQPLFRVKLA